MAVCGWCLAFDDTCCEGQHPLPFDCEHTRRCDVYVFPAFLAWCPLHGRDHYPGLVDCPDMLEGLSMTHILVETWLRLDFQSAKIAAEKTLRDAGGDPAEQMRHHEAMLLHKGRAEGMAQTIALLMPRQFPTVGDVAVEVAKRAWHRERSVVYQTPGLPEVRSAGGWYIAADGSFTTDPDLADPAQNPHTHIA